MPDPDNNSGRKATDDDLGQERRKTDGELAVRRADLDADADAVVALARQRADLILRAVRAKQDGAAPTTDSGEQRSHEDQLVAAERAAADIELHGERLNRGQLIASLLLAEREATDASLRMERGNSDRAVAARDDFLAGPIRSSDLRLG